MNVESLVMPDDEFIWTQDLDVLARHVFVCEHCKQSRSVRLERYRRTMHPRFCSRSCANMKRESAS